jgi:GNAT superfamily N-acetyltransferase
MQIRQLALEDPADFELLFGAIEPLFTELFGASAAPEPSTIARVREQLEQRPAAFWAFLATDAAASPLALLTLAESFAVFAHGHYGIINELWVRADARSQGVGARMLEHCQAFGRERGWYRIDVSAPSNPAWDRSFDFYVKHGFVHTGRKLRFLL